MSAPRPYYHITLFIFILVVQQQSDAQPNPQQLDQIQHTRTDDRDNHQTIEKRSPLLKNLPCDIMSPYKHNDFQESETIVRLLEEYPQCRDVILKDFFRAHLSHVADSNLSQSLCIGWKGYPSLENELRSNVQRYGVPNNPFIPRAYQIGTTFYLRDLISILKKLW